jgi:LAS superfamily LD-carboxypeptidase LdcB
MFSILLMFTLGMSNVDTYFYHSGYQDGKEYIFQASWIPGKDKNDRSLFLYSPASSAYKDMLESAAKQGIDLKLTYATRDHILQKRLKRRNPRLAAPPGYSPHEAGLAIDISGVVKHKRKTSIYYWLKHNAKQYCFYQPVKKEPWHWEFDTKCHSYYK